MAGFSSVGSGASAVSTMIADNVNFTGSGDAPTVNTNGQLLIGSTSSPSIQVGTITSPLGTVTIGYSSPNITLDISSSVQSGSTNLGITQSAGTTLTVNASNGTALSATNPAYVTLQSLTNPGRLITYKITANQLFTQAQLGNSLFGITTAVNWNFDMPFYLYAVSNANAGENAIAFMIARVPSATSSPVAGNIGQNGNTNASTALSMFSLTSITAADYASSPCLCLGCFRMQYVGSTTLWTIQTLSTIDGIGEFFDRKRFIMPRGQNGAASGSYFSNNGGTAPTFASDTLSYTVYKNGTIVCIFIGNAVSGGAGAVEARCLLPIPANLIAQGSGMIQGAGYTAVLFPTNITSATTFTNLYQNNAAGNGVLTNAQVNTANTNTQFQLIYDL